jgi:hypothetical protein
MSKRKATLKDENKENEEVVAKKIKNNKAVLHALQDINNNIINETDDQAETVAINKEQKLKKIKIVKKLLKEIDSSSYASVSGEARELNADVELIAKKFGDIQLPLYQTQAQQLIKVCKPVPNGQEFETIFDTVLSDTFQLEPSEFEISNDDWDENLAKLVKRVAKQLGCKGKVTANLYKMLLYTKGAHFKKHMDKKNEEDMFGTLIIQLPSIYTGGELEFYDDEKKAVNFAESLAEDSTKIYYAAHYCDVEHEILEVKSGYRLALVYNLCWANGNQTSFDIDGLTDQMTSTLDKLNGSDERIGFFLNHKYTGQAFETCGLKALKGIDNDRYNLLKNASDQLPDHKQLNFFVLSANLEIQTDKNQKFGLKVKSVNVYESENTIERLYDSSGKFYGKYELNFGLKDFLEIADLNKAVDEAADFADCKSWRNIVNQNNEYTRNNGMILATKFQAYMLVIMPKQAGAESKASIRFSAEKFLSSLSMDQISKEDAKLVEDFKSFSDSLISHSVANKAKIYLNEDHCYKILYILFRLDDVDLVKKLMSIINLEFSKTYFSICVKMIQKYGYEIIREILKIHLRDISGRLQLTRDFLKVIISFLIFFYLFRN